MTPTAASWSPPGVPRTRPRRRRAANSTRRQWWTAFERACAQAGILGRNRPAALAIAGQQHGLVVLDAAGAVLRPAKLWNDSESAPDADELVAALGAEWWAKACGSVPVASFTITKLRLAAALRARSVRPPGERPVASRLADRPAHRAALTTDRGDASGTGWWSPAEERYRADLLELVDDTVAVG